MHIFENFQHTPKHTQYLASILDSLRAAVREKFADEFCRYCLYARQEICGDGRKIEIFNMGDKDSDGNSRVDVRCLNFLEPTRENKMKLASFLLELKTKVD